MKVNILKATMAHSEQNGYLGHVEFEVEGHKKPYELTLQSDGRLDNWNYSLNFSDQPGGEVEIEAVEKAIEEEDELFDNLVEAAVNSQGQP